MTGLPVADPWYHARRLDTRLTLITEPHVHPIFSANMHLVEGAERDLLIDSGMGVAPLRPFVDGLRRDPGKPLVLLTTHAHVDHFGAAHEFEERLIHPTDAPEQAAPSAWSLDSADIPEETAQLFVEAGYEPLWPLLIDAVPSEGYDPAAWALKPALATGLVEEGDVIDLGDWQAEVLHLPGHAAGQVGLWHADSGTLFAADAVYDGPLIWQSAYCSVPDYAVTLRRLRELPVKIVHGGHDPAFGRARLVEICDEHLAVWDRLGLV